MTCPACRDAMRLALVCDLCGHTEDAAPAMSAETYDELRAEHEAGVVLPEAGRVLRRAARLNRGGDDAA